MHVIGIDPGLGGAVGILPEQRIVDTPTVKVGSKRIYLPLEMAAILLPYKGDKALAVIEQQFAMPGQGRTSILSIGTGFGIWLGILAAYRIPTKVVTSQRWKKVMLEGIGEKDKGASRRRAQEMFPALLHMLQRVKDHDRAEAILISEFGRKHLV